MSYWRVFSIPVRQRAKTPAVGVGVLAPLTEDEWDRFILRLSELKAEFLSEGPDRDGYVSPSVAIVRKLANHE